MRIDWKKSRLRIRIDAGRRVTAFWVILLGAGVATQSTGAQTQTGRSVGNSPLTVERVVDGLVEMNLRRAQALHSYHGSRIYRAEYKSSLNTLSAEMAVDVNYQAPRTKQFTIKSFSGSKLIIDKVLRKILQAEEDALSADVQQSTALNWENYDFKLIEYENIALHPKYVLAVEPRTKNKFLFRGRVWINASDFAVIRIEAEPAKNPSFWTKSSEIEQSYMKVDDFWLPERNHSISAIRIGGRAELIIEYMNYQITAADSVANAAAQGVARSVDSSRKSDGAQSSLDH